MNSKNSLTKRRRARLCCLVLTLVGTVGISACTTTDDFRRSYDTYSEAAPRYEGVFYGRGEGRTLEEATAGAMRDAAAQVESRVASRIEEDSFEVNRDGEVTFRQEFTSELDIETDLLLQGLTRIDSFSTPEGYHFALAAYDREDALPTEEIHAELRSAANRRKTTSSLMSAILPGTGQIRDGFRSRGLTMAGVAAALATTATVSFITADRYYAEYSNASNDTEREAYYDYYQGATTVGIVSLILYGVDGIISAVDIWSSERP